MGVVSQRLRDSARGQECTFAIPGHCNHDRATVVLCHLSSDVKGMGNKSDDFHAAFGCVACHEAIDQHRLTRADELYHSFRALQRTQRIWLEQGLLVITGEREAKPRPLGKIVPRPEKFRR